MKRILLILLLGLGFGKELYLYEVTYFNKGKEVTISNAAYVNKSAFQVTFKVIENKRKFIHINKKDIIKIKDLQTNRFLSHKDKLYHSKRKNRTTNINESYYPYPSNSSGDYLMDAGIQLMISEFITLAGTFTLMSSAEPSIFIVCTIASLAIRINAYNKIIKAGRKYNLEVISND